VQNKIKTKLEKLINNSHTKMNNKGFQSLAQLAILTWLKLANNDKKL